MFGRTFIAKFMPDLDFKIVLLFLLLPLPKVLNDRIFSNHLQLC